MRKKFMNIILGINLKQKTRKIMNNFFFQPNIYFI